MTHKARDFLPLTPELLRRVYKDWVGGGLCPAVGDAAVSALPLEARGAEAQRAGNATADEQETRSMTEHEVPLQNKFCGRTLGMADGTNLKCQLVDGHPGPCLWLMHVGTEAPVSRAEFTALTKQVEGLARDVATLTNALRDYEVRREARMREHREALFAFEADQRRREREFLARIAAAAERLAGTDSFSLGVPRIKL